MLIKRGDIFYADLNPTKGSEQAGRRPVIVIQNNTGNKMAPTTIVAPLTTKKFLKEYPTNVHVKKSMADLKEDSVILLAQIRTVDKNRLGRKIGAVSGEFLKRVDEAIKISLGLD